MNFPAELKYSNDHEWVKFEDGIAVVGISDFAQDALGDVVFVNLPQVGDEVTAGETFGDVESVKAVSDLICPVSGVVCEINEELDDSPENLNSDPYGAWIIKVENVTEEEELLAAGVILHDLCKTEEMDSDEMGVVRDYSREGLLLGHLVLGVTRIQEAANELGIQSEEVLLLQHMMLSHNGEAEFGSPRKPMFPEAEALHWVDLLDARMNEMQTAISKLKPGVFSEKIWSLDRRLYRPQVEDNADA